jgi:hypothetical protein
MNWAKLKGQLFFLIMRAQYGKTVDKKFATYWPAAKGIGLRRIFPFDKLPKIGRLAKPAALYRFVLQYVPTTYSIMSF